MTREEFIEDICSFGDLREFCWDNRLSSMDYIKDADEIDEYIDELLYEFARTDGWQDIRRWLNDIDDSYDWYDTEDGIVGLTQWDFDEYKERVLQEGDGDEIWDDEEDGEDEAEPYSWEPKRAVINKWDYIAVTDVDDEVDADELLLLAVKTA